MDVKESRSHKLHQTKVISSYQIHPKQLLNVSHFLKRVCVRELYNRNHPVISTAFTICISYLWALKVFV